MGLANPALKANLAAELTLKMESFLFRIVMIVGAVGVIADYASFLSEGGGERGGGGMIGM